jgi:hypothetical protein
MILACLFDAGLSLSEFQEAIDGLGIGQVKGRVEEVSRSGIRAKSFTLDCGGNQVARTHADIVALIDNSGLPGRAAGMAIDIFGILADAEARVHGTSRDQVHFHEVGAADSIVDIVGACFGIERLGLDKVVSSPIALGRGSVACEHGTLPVPSPATAEIVRGLPVRGWDIEAELTTPTGAAILRSVASDFGPVPGMRVATVGYGAGSRDLGRIPNVMRLLIGESVGLGADRVTLLEANIDDMNPQVFSHLYEKLLGQGALDVWVTSIVMKKGRPGFLLAVLAAVSDVPHLAHTIMAETTTSGVRTSERGRLKLARETVDVETRYGTIRAKVFHLDSGNRAAPEYDDCARLAAAAGVPVIDVIEEARYVLRHRFDKET